MTRILEKIEVDYVAQTVRVQGRDNASGVDARLVRTASIVGAFSGLSEAYNLAQHMLHTDETDGQSK